MGKWQIQRSYVKMKMGRRITLVLFHKPCRKNEDELI